MDHTNCVSSTLATPRIGHCIESKCHGARGLRAETRWLLAVTAACLTGFCGIAQAQQALSAAGMSPPMQENLSGNWVRDFKRGNFGVESGDPAKPIALNDGQIVPLRPEFEKLYRARLKMNQTTRPFAGTTSRCLPPGTPYNMMGPPYPIRIVQQPNFIAILLEEGWTFRAVYMNEKHPDQLIPSFMGHSIGHWDGKTLVIETVGMRDDTSLNGSGLPHSNQMSVVERLSRPDPDTLIDRVEVNDPVDYTKPFTFESIYVRSAQKQMEYICEKNNIQVDAEGRQVYGPEK